MQKNIKSAFVILLALFALLVILAAFFGALKHLSEAEPISFVLGALSFVASIIVWLASWAMLIKEGQFSKKILTGFSCVFASLTPVQVGADAMRSLRMKKLFAVPYRETLAASMAVKGMKFLLIALVASASFFLAMLNPGIEPWLKLTLLSGFAVVATAAALFLLPLSRRIGSRIAYFFEWLSHYLRQAKRLGAKRFFPRLFALSKRLSGYFEHYSLYMREIPASKLALVALLALASIAFEFLAFAFCFASVNASIPLYSMVVLFSILAILEHVPFLPRGIGVVEIFGILFLSLESISAGSLSMPQVVAIIILFDFMRLVIPALLSLAAYCALSKKAGKAGNDSRWPALPKHGNG
ncbi:MAG: flippase-like domain-containing protein [archaeon]